jgi:hypothetical protein
MKRDNIELIQILLRDYGRHCCHSDCNLCPKRAVESEEALKEFEELIAKETP